MFEIKGRIEVISPEVQVSEKFRKREFVLQVQDGMYPQYIKMQLTQERCALVDGCAPGMEVNVTFVLKGRPFEKQGETIYFTNIEAIRVSAASQAAPAAPAAGYPTPPAPTSNPFAGGDSEGDDLPF